ncbi:hypothetical protein GOC74_12175 [Halomicrobium mukohataei]|uniref:Uncharacterized protein n=1 Tax=Halomicrobium mukohataei TaxID=57705 RepID=A0A847TXD8_9EURY|nr:hypothetical protein [Halomicrobium mukohataei]NLV10682.1 hypothetical protein [Halomicrobium mukohataei]
MSRSQRPDQTTRRRVGDEDVRVRLWRSDPEFAARIEIDSEEPWVFGVDTEGIATPLTTAAATDTVCDPDIPGWVTEILVGLGVVDIQTRGDA